MRNKGRFLSGLIVCLFVITLFAVRTYASEDVQGDPAKENVLTHIKRIRNLVRETEVVERPVFAKALSKSLDRIRSLEYQLDIFEHLQTPEETDRLRKGDCEDLTSEFLLKMRTSGVPLDRLGLYIHILPSGGNHISPIFQDGQGKWLILNIYPPKEKLDEVLSGKICSLKEISPEELNGFVLHRQLILRASDISVYLIKGLDDNSKVEIEEGYDVIKMSWDEWLKGSEDAYLEQGYAID